MSERKSMKELIDTWEDVEFGHYQCDCVPATAEQVGKLVQAFRDEGYIHKSEAKGLVLPEKESEYISNDPKPTVEELQEILNYKPCEIMPDGRVRDNEAIKWFSRRIGNLLGCVMANRDEAYKIAVAVLKEKRCMQESRKEAPKNP